MIEGTVRPGYAGSFQVRGEKGSSFFAVYSSRALANGWEPLDQPNPAAYLPVRFDQLKRVPLGRKAKDARYFLLRPRSNPLHGVITASQTRFVRDLLKKLDLDTDEIDACIADLAAP